MTIRIRTVHLWVAGAVIAALVLGFLLGRETADDPQPILYAPPAAGTSPEEGAASQTPVEVETEGRPARGPEDAEVTVVEFVDFECPFCGSYARETLPRVEREYGDEIRYVSRHFPLSMHPHAQAAAAAAECAFEQGRFWGYHRLLFANQDALDEASLKGYARRLGLDLGEFDSCRRSPETRARIQGDLADGRRYGVTGTPAFFINGVVVRGAQPFEQIAATIDAALAEEG